MLLGHKGMEFDHEANHQ